MILIIKQYDYACLYSPVSQFRKTLLFREENIIGAPRKRNNFPFFCVQERATKMKQIILKATTLQEALDNSPILLLQY